MPTRAGKASCNVCAFPTNMINSNVREVPKHMKELGCTMLARSIYDCTFNEMFKPFAHVMSVNLSVNGAELVLKARIAEEHPLWIFESFPKIKENDELLGIEGLFESGRTISYKDIPKVLWDTTGIRMEKVDEFLKYGKIRNTITHFAAPPNDYPKETYHYVFEVIDPMIEKFWKTSFIEFLNDWDGEIITDGYLEEKLERVKIKLTKTAKKHIKKLKKEAKN